MNITIHISLWGYSHPVHDPHREIEEVKGKIEKKGSSKFVSSISGGCLEASCGIYFKVTAKT